MSGVRQSIVGHSWLFACLLSASVFLVVIVIIVYHQEYAELHWWPKVTHSLLSVQSTTTDCDNIISGQYQETLPGGTRMAKKLTCLMPGQGTMKMALDPSLTCLMKSSRMNSVRMWCRSRLRATSLPSWHLWPSDLEGVKAEGCLGLLNPTEITFTQVVSWSCV